ncbi:unnamed protein product [Mesocestoides corti]|uniref:Glutamate-rich protein 2 n=1 Tax=Mesocestoides corti TaxID=53468 RepID=A0A0R3UL87_MESCO|nr:unnamed protein product [Mesocestoides corti]
MTGSGDNTPLRSDSNVIHQGASNELLLEFLDSVMYKRFDVALRLCRKIIDEEPDNYEAHAFLPMLEEAQSLKSTGYFNPLDVSSSEESEGSNREENERKRERRISSSSSEEWDYSTTTSDSEDLSGQEDDD